MIRNRKLSASIMQPRTILAIPRGSGPGGPDDGVETGRRAGDCSAEEPVTAGDAVSSMGVSRYHREPIETMERDALDQLIDERPGIRRVCQ